MTTNERIIAFDDIEKICSSIHNEGEKIVTTNGCFDILHQGHLKYLESASLFGEVFIVGINSDSSVKRIKGEKRPIVVELERAEIIASFSAVDYVVIFNEDDPRELLSKIKPDIHVKGGDYTKDIIEAGIVEMNGGKVEILQFVAGESTSIIIEKILENK